MWPTTVLSLCFPCRNVCAENVVIFFYEIKLLFTYLPKACEWIKTNRLGSKYHATLTNAMKKTALRLQAVKIAYIRNTVVVS